MLNACDAIDIRQLLRDMGVKGLAMIVVIRQGSVNLPHRQVRVLPLNLLGVPVMGVPPHRTGSEGETTRSGWFSPA